MKGSGSLEKTSNAVGTAFLSFLVHTMYLSYGIENCFFFLRYELFLNANVYILLSTASVHCRHPIQTPSCQHSYSDTSPRLSPCSDNACSSSDCDSEPDQVSTHSEQPPRKKRQRTTFSPIEVWELERAYRRRPYLMSADEEDLVQRLGITAKSLKVRFNFNATKF